MADFNYTFTLTGNKVTVDEYDGITATRKFTFNADYNVLPVSDLRPKEVAISRNANFSGTDKDTFVFDISKINTNPTPTDREATIAWLTTNYFKGLAIVDVSVDTVNVNVANNEKQTILNERENALRTFTYYAGVEAGNPSGNKNVKTIVYSSATAPAITVTETFAYDADDDVLTITTT